MIITERLDGSPESISHIDVQRDETMLHQWPEPGNMNIWGSYEPIQAINLPMEHIKGPFAPPQGVFRSDHIHIEYQKMNGRQPFYHRNTDCDEISYHVAGKRTVVTELGSVDLQVGDMARIPVGIAHDNIATDDVHLIFYLNAGTKEVTTPYRSTEYRMPPFPDWKPVDSIEFITGQLGQVGTDISTFYTSEQMLLDHAASTDQRMAVVRHSGLEGTQWLYKNDDAWIGVTKLDKTDGYLYLRHRKAYELQLQTQGQRTLVTQRGTLRIEPGDCLVIPLGTAFTSIANEKNEYITMLLRQPPEAKKEFSKTAEPTTEDLFSKARNASATVGLG